MGKIASPVVLPYSGTLEKHLCPSGCRPEVLIIPVLACTLSSRPQDAVVGVLRGAFAEEGNLLIPYQGGIDEFFSAADSQKGHLSPRTLYKASIRECLEEAGPESTLYSSFLIPPISSKMSVVGGRPRKDVVKGKTYFWERKCMHPLIALTTDMSAYNPDFGAWDDPVPSPEWYALDELRGKLSQRKVSLMLSAISEVHMFLRKKGVEKPSSLESFVDSHIQAA